MTETVSIRRATVDDLDALLDLREAVAKEGIWIGAELPLDREGDRRRFATTIEDQDDGTSAVMLVANLEGGTVVGSLAMQNPIGIAHLGMNVADGYRGAGIGHALVTAGIEWARQAGAHKVDLEHWPWNHRARALYERSGFVEEGYKRRHYRRKDGSLWDAVVMGLVLDRSAPGHDVRATEPPTSEPPT